MRHIPKIQDQAVCGPQAPEDMGCTSRLAVVMVDEGVAAVVDPHGYWCAQCKDGLSRGFARAAITVDNEVYETIDAQMYSEAFEIRLREWPGILQ